METEMERTVSATEARVHFGELLRQVQEQDDTVIVERGGEPAAAVLSMESYQRLRSTGEVERWRETLARAREVRQKVADRRQGTLPPPEDLIRESREVRDEALTRVR